MGLCKIYFRVMLIFNSSYVYGGRCSITLHTVLTFKQNILRLPTFTPKPGSQYDAGASVVSVIIFIVN